MTGQWRRQDSFAALAPLYDGFIFDVWGTLYGGGPVFDGARDVLERLADMGKPVVVLSNAPRPSDVVANRLGPLGIPAHLYREIITSGSEARRALIERRDPDHAALGPLCHAFGPNRFQDLLPGTNFKDGAPIGKADWIWNAGPDGNEDTVEMYRDRLVEGRARGLVMVCANPDLHVVDKGEKRICAGALAVAYEELGGRVLYHGKPYRPVLDRAVAALGPPGSTGGLASRSTQRILVVGDNRATDIKGAVAAGLDSLLLADGIDADVLIDGNGNLDDACLKAFADIEGPNPSWIATRLAW
jgi:HAD superfamily hydrolase (TIGR01459 family)